MRIAILGATSQIAKDLILSFSVEKNKHLHLFARRPDEIRRWLNHVGLSEQYPAYDFSVFASLEFDVIINFVGVGDPAQIVAIGSAIFETTLHFDEMVINYLRLHPECRYLYLSSGAAYCSDFQLPADPYTKTTIELNNLKPENWYSLAKLHAECRHRSLSHFSIVDIRVFNYFSHTQNIHSRYLMTEVCYAIKFRGLFRTSSVDIVRDYIYPPDLYKLFSLIIASEPQNTAVDCYSLAPASKLCILRAMKDNFGLNFEISPLESGLVASGIKPHYYSLNKKAAEFGFEPTMTSIDSVIGEASLLLGDK